MKKHRFLGKFHLNGSVIRIDDKELVHQIRNVLKLKVGEIIILGDGNMNETEARIVNFKKGFIELEKVSLQTNNNEPKRKISLFCTILKNENFEWVVQKATELGINEIFPMITNRTVKLNLKPERLNRIIKEASEQSGRGIIPVLHEAVDFDTALEKSAQNDENFLFDMKGENFKDNLSYKSDKIGIFIGPEGGWADDELLKAKNKGLKILNLGPRVLRAETAAIVAVFWANI